ncbi:TolB family protein [Virgibacillus flavescens]|uniref:TolB family protein n=1 Tax=Virgibacillus flavescens TaxID=1611422 RepID=UPI003D329BA1
MQSNFTDCSGVTGLIAYTTNRGGSYDIWLYDPRNGTNKQITSNLGESFSIPFWSPDNKRIAFVGKNEILFVIQLKDGSIAQLDQFAEGLGVYLDWSTDSQKLVYTNRNEIIVYHVNTHRVQQIRQPGVTDVQWFPDGIHLLFQAPDPSGISQLYYMKIDGTNKQQITQNTGGPFNTVRLSPDGLYVLYTTPGVSISIIFTIELSSGNIYEVRGGPLAKNYFPVWSPDSSMIAYSATNFGNSGYYSQIRVAGKRGENDLILSISDCYASPVAWSVDGQKIAYLSGCKNEGSANEMLLIDLSHPKPKQLIDDVSITALQWSLNPVYGSKNSYSNEIYKVKFSYPSHWQMVTDLRYEGPDGFFQISAISSDESITSVCQNEAFHQLLPYGSSPRIVNTHIQNQQACFIFPSNDQPLEMREQAALIVRYPKPITIADTAYNYFILWADQHHIEEISSTLVLLK